MLDGARCEATEGKEEGMKADIRRGGTCTSSALAGEEEEEFLGIDGGESVTTQNLAPEEALERHSDLTRQERLEVYPKIA